MARVKIITDSCSDLPAEIIEKYEIEFLNIPVNINEKIYYDRADLKPVDFYQKITERKEVPRTSRITPAEFKKVYQKYCQEYDHLLVIAFSSQLSGILESAVIAKNEFKREISSRKNKSAAEITIIDSKAASVGQGLLVYQAAEMLAAGKELSSVIDQTAAAASKLEHVFAVGDLKMLQKGGRISKTKAAVANVLNIKPILHIQDGKILAYDKVRGKKRMINYLLTEIEKKADKPEEQILAVTYSKDKSSALKLKKELEKKFKPKEILISEIGAAVGSHAGPGTLAVVYKNSEKIADIKIY